MADFYVEPYGNYPIRRVYSAAAATTAAAANRSAAVWLRKPGLEHPERQSPLLRLQHQRLQRPHGGLRHAVVGRHPRP